MTAVCRRVASPIGAPNDPPVNAFWKYAKRLLDRRGALALAVFFAFLAASGMGAGLIGLVPILDNLLGEDGVHFNDEGYRFLAEREGEAIRAR